MSTSDPQEIVRFIETSPKYIAVFGVAWSETL